MDVKTRADRMRKEMRDSIRENMRENEGNLRESFREDVMYLHTVFTVF